LAYSVSISVTAWAMILERWRRDEGDSMV
jgi:hypothetical protein